MKPAIMIAVKGSKMPFFKKIYFREFSSGPVVRAQSFQYLSAIAGVSPLVRSHKPHGTAKIEKKIKLFSS